VLIIAISVVLFLLLVVVMQVIENKRRTLKRQRQAFGLSVLKSGLELMTAVQQHRGMSIAFLNGDNAFKPKMLTKRQDIQNLLGRMPDFLAEAPELLPDIASLVEIRRQWDHLVETSAQQIPETSFKQHTGLVREIIHLMGDMGEHLGLLDGEGSSLALLSNTLLLKLPLLLESIGQARALGSGYAAKGQVGAVGRIRLTFLDQRIRECYDGIREAAVVNEAVSKRVEALLDTLQNRFIVAESVDISSATFFQTATDAIDACLLLWTDVAQHTGAAVSKHK
jgi:hypothetical protein